MKPGYTRICHRLHRELQSKDPELIGSAIALVSHMVRMVTSNRALFGGALPLLSSPQQCHEWIATAPPWYLRFDIFDMYKAFWGANMFGDVTRFSKTRDLTEKTQNKRVWYDGISLLLHFVSVQVGKFGGQMAWPQNFLTFPFFSPNLGDWMLSSSRLDCLGEPLTENTLDDFVRITWHQLQLLQHLEPHLSAAVRSCQLCSHDIKPSCYTSPA